MISLNDISVRFGGFELLSGVSFLVNQKDRIGLVGKNGAGKSTILKIITGELTPDEGRLGCPNDIRFGYLPQQMKCSNEHSVWEETGLAFEEVRELEQLIAKISTIINSRSDTNSDEYLRLIDKLVWAGERFEILGGRTVKADIEQTLMGLGFLPSDFYRPTAELSGGWRMRIELAKILLKKPDVLLLDEPTNHLDIESIQWLELFMSDFPGAVVLISHDRAFLDNVTKRTIEISMGRIYDYKVPYSRFTVLRKERRDQQLAAYNNQQKLIKDNERFIERFRYKNTKSVQVQSRIKMLDKLDRIEVDEEDRSAMHFRFPPAPRSGTIVIEAVELSKSYDEHQVLKEIDLIIERGEKVAFVGRNGEGKTTLSRIIAGNLDHTGVMKLGHNVSIGYYAQNQDELLDESRTVLETIDEAAVGDIRTKIRDILGAFLFSGEDVDKKVKVLSGGERSRLALAMLLLKPYNLLVLDEPTNHLDMRSKDILKNALLRFDGTLVLVSHDRYFLDGLVSKVFEFKGKKIRENIGGIYDFLRRKKIESLKELELKEQVKIIEKNTVPSQNKTDYENRKESEKLVRKAANAVQRSEKRIEELERDIAAIDKILTDPSSAQADLNDPHLYDKYEKLKTELEKEMENWEKVYDEHESLKNMRK